ncbi:MAG: hypothetical protein Q7S48_01400 [bacterium]|nr:hypothetical protein [bacterium]
MTAQKTQPSAMAFYNPNGFVPAFKQAVAFAGKDGRVATLPDILEARLTIKPGEYPWEAYFTTMSAEYVGLSKAGNPIAIVAHGIGPMATLNGVLAAYSHEFNDKERNHRGGRILQEEFLKLESGYYGSVQIVDIVATWNRRPYQFSGHAITAKEITEEPLWQARLGKSWREYVEHHTACARKWHFEQAGGDPENKYGSPNHAEYCDRRRAMHLRLANVGSNPCILGMDDASNCSYFGREMFDHWMKATPGTAIAHLISIGGLAHSHHDYYEYDYNRREQRESLASDVSCHEWWNGTRLLGIQPGEDISVHPGIPSYSELVKRHLDQLWGANPKGKKETVNGFWHLVEMGKRHFTDYPKQGERMDSHEPEFLVTKIEEVAGNPRKFRTTVGGYHGFFKYGIDEVKRIAPPEANAYTVGDVEIEWKDGNPTHHVAPVTFYKIEVDTTQRLVRMEDIYRDFDLMMSLVD